MSQTRPAILGELSPFAAALECEAVAGGIERVRLVLTAAEPAPPPPVSLEWCEPLADAALLWTTAAGRAKGLPASWEPLELTAKATSEAPLVSLVSGGGINRVTVACADALEVVSLEAGVVEETGELRWRVTAFSDLPAPAREAIVELRIDRRAVRFEEALSGARDWWAHMPSCRPSPVPEVARAPMYSTWYSFHQRLEPAAVEDECRRARALGCEAVILDDGWQTLDASRGYAYTGDWEPERIPALGEHVARLHELGMKVLLWYSVPFVGMRSRAYQRFQDRLLYVMDERGAGILDPRYPEVRDFLIETWERAVSEWDLDGLKLDFVDRFKMDAGAPPGDGRGRDFGSVMQAVDRLLGDAMERLRSIRPEVMIEFRQPYIGPLMRRYGNMFRANDCPADHVRNRISVVDIRLLAGDTACHSDMLMWHPDEPAESAALQLLAVLFAVPQISVRLGALPSDHIDMLRFWLGFWRRRRDTLLDGELRVASPELGYPMVSARGPKELVAAAYADVAIPVGAPGSGRVFLVNATRGDAVTVVTSGETVRRRVRASDCRGRVASDEERELPAGAHRLAVPPAGLVEIF